MALINCRECGRQISKRAKKCPGCGAPVKRGSSIIAIGCLAVIGLFTFVFCAGLIGIGSNVSEFQSFPVNSPTSKPSGAPDILNGVDYTIINDDTLLDFKRSVDVRLKEQITEDQLRELALKIKSDNPTEFERTFIVYILPGMKLNAGAWATTHFNPDLEVRVLGLTVDQDKKLRQLPANQPPGYLGSWLIEDGEVSRRLSIFKKNGAFYLETMYRDGNTGEEQLIEKQHKGGRKFIEVKHAGSKNDFYIIDDNSNLQIWYWDILEDTHVLYKTLKKLK